MTQAELFNRVKQGEPDALAALLNHYLQPKGITATATLQDGCLHLFLEGPQVPNRQALSAYVQQGLIGLRDKLGAEYTTFRAVRLYGTKQGKPAPAWEEPIDLGASSNGSAPDLAADLTPEAIASVPENVIEAEEPERASSAIALPSQLTPTGADEILAIVPVTPPGAPSRLWAKVRAAIALLLLLGLAGAAATFAWYWSRQLRAVSQSQNLRIQVGNVAAIADLPTLQTVRQSLQTTVDRLEALPVIPVVSHGPVEAEIAEVQPLLSEVQDRLATEELAQANLQAALRQAQQAETLSQQATTPEQWDQVAQMWQAAIAHLVVVPENTLAAAQVQEQRLLYQQNYQEARDQLTKLRSAPPPAAAAKP